MASPYEPGKGYLTVSQDLRREQGVETNDERRIVSFYNVRPFDLLHTDEFTLDTVVRHSMEDGRYLCGHADLAVIGERSAIAIAVGIPGCAGDLAAIFGEVYLDGSTNDLSALGVDLATWQRVQVQLKDRSVRTEVGSNAPFTSNYTMDVGRVVGLQYRFEGSGAIDHVALKDGEERVVYEEAF